MTNPIEELTAKFLQTCDQAGESEQRVIDRLTSAFTSAATPIRNSKSR